MGLDLSVFYDDPKRLKYNPVSSSFERVGFKKLIAYDDRFDSVKKELESLINKIHKRPVRILDVGVGDGIYESILDSEVKKKCEFYGIDISIKQAQRARVFMKEVKIVDLNMDNIPYPNNFFDICILSEILEHVFYPEKLIEETGRVLRKKFFLLITVPNSASLQLRLAILIKGASPLLNYPENKEHIRFFTSADIQNMVKDKFKILYLQGLSSFLFDKWNFFMKIPMPWIFEKLGNKFLPNLALGNLLVLQKK